MARRTPLFGIGAAVSFSISSVLIRAGLAAGVPSVIGLWVGFATALAVYLPLLAAQRKRLPAVSNPGRGYLLQVLAGIAIAFAMWFRYIAMNTVPVGFVTALGRVNIPLILILSPIFLKARIDATSLRLWMGSLLIVGGAVVVVFAP